MAKSRSKRVAKSGKGDGSGTDETGKAASPARNAGSILVWTMLGLIVFGLGGYGITNFGGGVQSIGNVGEHKIETGDYARAMRQELRAFSAQTHKPISMQDALAMGLDRRVIQQLVTTAALDDEAARLGISVGDDRLRKEIVGMSAFQGPSGFDADTYGLTLKQNGLTKKSFETKVRNDLSRGILQSAIVNGVAAPQTYVDTLIGYIGEQRGMTLLKLTADDLPKPLGAPTDAQLKAYYKAHIADYTSLETKRITYASLLPEMLLDKAKVDEKALHELYKQNIAHYVKPERRLVERLVYPTEDEAKAARAKLDAGTATFKDLVAARGLKLSDTDMGDVAKSDLAPAAADAVFALKAPGVVGPVQSSLGPALFRMNGILAAQNTTFEQARDSLATDAKLDRAKQMIGDRIEDINDRLAGGATVEDLAKETDMQLGHIDFTAESKDGIAAYPAFRSAANKATVDDFPDVVELSDGGIVSLQLDNVEPPAPIPFDKVADRVGKDWRRAETLAQLTKRADTIKGDVEKGARLDAYGTVTAHPPMLRSDMIEGVPAGVIAAVFKLPKDGVAVVPGQDSVWLARLDKVEPVDPTDPDIVKARARLSAQAAQGIASDAFGDFATAVLSQVGIHLDQAVINAVNAQLH